MRIVVTGASGFLGQAFCKAAILNGHKILAVCRTKDSILPSGCECTFGSLSDVSLSEIEHFKPDAALHLAWIATPGIYLNSTENDVLVEQSHSFFQGLIRIGIGYVAGTGTCIEYAPSMSPLMEDTSPLSPAFPYSRAKVETFNLLRKLAQDAGIEWAWFRVFYPYGEGEQSGRMPSALMRNLAGGGTLELKTPDSVKDYIHVVDAADAMLTALEHRLNGAINIGTGEGIRIIDLAKKIAGCCGVDSERVNRASILVEDPNPVTVADLTQLRKADWRPRITLDEGLSRLRDSLQL